MPARIVSAGVATYTEIEWLSMDSEPLVERGEEYVSLSPKML